MGVKLLSSFVTKTCNSAMKKMNLSALRGKVIVVDIMNYIYKFMKTSIMDNIHTMFDLFKRYNIIPIFVFDGKPSDRKKEIVHERVQKRMNEYHNANQQTPPNSEKIKKESVVHLQNSTIAQIKDTMKQYDFHFIQTSDKEADEICVSLIKEGHAWACLSEDSDMFAFGIPKILKNINLEQSTVSCYSMDTIYAIYQMQENKEDFLKICHLAGTDYYKITNLGMDEAFRLYTEYNAITNAFKCFDFYNWLCILKKIQIPTEKLINANLSPYENMNLSYEKMYNEYNFSTKNVMADINYNEIHEYINRQTAIFTIP